jgi:hypothetical protein
VVDVVPHGCWKTSTFIGALRGNGLAAPGRFDGPINGDAFIAYVEQEIEAAGASLMFFPLTVPI